MPYIYAAAESLEGRPKVGSKHCVALIQRYSTAPHTSAWKPGARVRNLSGLKKGTAIATFVDGVYPNHASGNHAAFYLRQDSGGIWVIDQWKNDQTKPSISKRYIRYKGMSANGNYVNPSNNADAYSVID